MDDTRNWAILRTASGIVDLVQKALPPDHRIIADRPMPERFDVDLLIEGPHFAAIPAGRTPPFVKMVFQKVGTEVTARWEHLPDVTWQVTL